MPVKINDIFISPAPIVTIGKTYIQNMYSGPIGAEYSIFLNGDLVAWKGNPESSGSTPTVSQETATSYGNFDSDDEPINTSLGVDGYLGSIIKKQEHLRELLVDHGSGIKLEITGFDTATDEADNRGITAYCTLTDLNFDDKTRWTNGCGYSVSLTTSKLTKPANVGLFGDDSTEDNFGYYVSDAQNEWSISEDEEHTATIGSSTDQKKIYSVSHNVSAIGQKTYENGVLINAIHEASGYVHNVIGLGSGEMTNPSGPFSFLGFPEGYSVYNRKVTESINPFTGQYGIDEQFIMGPSGQAAKEVVQISIENDLSPLTKVSINGTITGFNSSGVQDGAVNSYDNALAYWDSVSGSIYDRANSEAGSCSLNPVFLSRAIGRNPQEGTISYSFNYDNRPANVITNARTEDIQVSDTYPGQVINVVPVIGRSQPIIQYLNSRSEYKRSLQITATMDMGADCLPQKPPASELATIFETYKPQGTKVYYGPPTDNWNPKTGQYSYNVEWTYEG